MTEPREASSTPNGSEAGEGGILFRVDGELYFLPASVALRVVPVPDVAPVPGAPREIVGVALVDGDILPVVNVAAPQRSPSRPPLHAPSRAVAAMLVCAATTAPPPTAGDASPRRGRDTEIERVGLVGLDVVATPLRYAPRPIDAADERSEAAAASHARLFDVGAVVARIREGRWAV